MEFDMVQDKKGVEVGEPQSRAASMCPSAPDPSATHTGGLLGPTTHTIALPLTAIAQMQHLMARPVLAGTKAGAECYHAATSLHHRTPSLLCRKTCRVPRAWLKATMASP